MEMEPSLRAACAIFFSEFHGHKFNRQSMRFEEAE